MKNNYQTAAIINIEKETEKVKNFILDTKIIAKPGQYVMVWIPGENEKPFGVVSSSPLMLSIAKVGPFTQKIHQLKIGDKLTFRGPYGSFYKIKGKEILLVGGGYGVVPLYFLALTTPKSKRKNITVVIGARSKSDLAFVKKFKNLGCNIFLSTDDGTAGHKGFSTELAEELMNKKHFDSVYTCGPEVMMKKVAMICQNRKIFCQVSLEKFFKCGGIGLCGECSFKGQLVCSSGPIFNGKILLD